MEFEKWLIAEKDKIVTAREILPKPPKLSADPRDFEFYRLCMPAKDYLLGLYEAHRAALRIIQDPESRGQGSSIIRTHLRDSLGSCPDCPMREHGWDAGSERILTAIEEEASDHI